MSCQHTEQRVQRVQYGWEIYCRQCDCFLGRHGNQGGTAPAPVQTETDKPVEDPKANTPREAGAVSPSVQAIVGNFGGGQ